MFDHWTLKKRLTLTFTGILLLAGALISVALVNNGKLRDTVNWNTHTYKVLAQSDSMLLNMVNIETGLRGYVAGGTRSFSSRSRRASRPLARPSRKPSR